MYLFTCRVHSIGRGTSQLSVTMIHTKGHQLIKKERLLWLTVLEGSGPVALGPMLVLDDVCMTERLTT